ncbi:CarD family transcriptional regulator [Acidobacteriota bacterium]
MFKKGERVVYPNHGIGVIEEIQDLTVDGQDWNCYCLKIESSDTRVMVPTDKADMVGLRKIINKRDAERVFSLLKNGSVKMQSNWKGRFKENSDKMRTGSIFEVAEVLKNLNYLSHVKSLSYREKRMLEKARQLIVSEVAVVKNVAEDKVEAQLERALGNKKKSTTSH